ncbi:MAG: hypothetical protein WCP32_01385 [Bacteroidota bacterium]
MRTIILIILLSPIYLFTFSQNIIPSDTVISKMVNVNESFELNFLNSPGSGYFWYLPIKYDSTKVNVRLTKSEVMHGDFPKGGRWIYTYTFSGLSKGTFLLEYYYGRSLLNEKINTCVVNLTIN